MIEPDGPDFARRHRHRARLLGLLDKLMSCGIVSSPRKIVSLPTTTALTLLLWRARSIAEPDFALVARLILVDPGADRDAQAELGRNRRHKLRAAGRRISADRLGEGGNRLQVGADLRGGRAVGAVGMIGVRQTGSTRRWIADG